MIRETRTRLAESKLGYGWALLEPVLHILMLSLVFAVMMRGRPPIGDKFFIFYYTGIIRYSGANGTKLSCSARAANLEPNTQFHSCCG
jgi:ABC-type polysaccharide/polyol phosphate export permease